MNKEMNFSISKKKYFIASAIISLIVSVILSFICADVMNNTGVTNGNNIFSTAIIFLPIIFVIFEVFSLLIIIIFDKSSNNK